MDDATNVEMIVHTEWWLMWCDFPNLNWARLRVYADGSSDVFDMDGRLIKFATAQEARDDLSEDEYSELSHLDNDDEGELLMPLADIKPPIGESEVELLPMMYVKFKES